MGGPRAHYIELPRLQRPELKRLAILVEFSGSVKIALFKDPVSKNRNAGLLHSSFQFAPAWYPAKEKNPLPTLLGVIGNLHRIQLGCRMP